MKESPAQRPINVAKLSLVGLRALDLSGEAEICCTPFNLQKRYEDTTDKVVGHGEAYYLTGPSLLDAISLTESLRDHS